MCGLKDRRSTPALRTLPRCGHFRAGKVLHEGGAGRQARRQCSNDLGFHSTCRRTIGRRDRWPITPPRSSHADEVGFVQSPRHIKLLFSLRTDATWSTVKLERNDGTVLAEKTQPTTSRSFSMDAPKLSPGDYRVQYSMLTPDGDFLRGEVDFVVDEPEG